MNKTEKVLVITLAVATAMGLEIVHQKRYIRKLNAAHTKLLTWGKLSQRIMNELIEKNPMIVKDISEELAMDLAFYGMMSDENLI